MDERKLDALGEGARRQVTFPREWVDRLADCGL